jgi:predicted Zn-dependent protease
MSRLLPLTLFCLTLLVTTACGQGFKLDKNSLKGAIDILGGAPDGGTPGGVPLIGNPDDLQETALGREIAGRLLAAVPPLRQEALQNYVNQVGRYVAAQSDRPTLPWTFAVIDSDDINAFAAPGGYIFVTRGLYQVLDNEAELAAVLGHEIAHVNERHQVKLLQKNRVLALGQELLTRKVKNESAKTLAGTGVEVFARALDKEDEFTCDRLGIIYAARAGYDPYAYIALLDRLGIGSDNDRLALLFKTHPHPADRVAALAEAIGSHWDALPVGAAPARLMRLPAAAK